MIHPESRRTDQTTANFFDFKGLQLFSGPHEPDTFINQYLCHSERETSVTRKKQKSRRARSGHAFARQVQPGAFDREIFDRWGRLGAVPHRFLLVPSWH
jgi:hypothetical protein